MSPQWGWDGGCLWLLQPWGRGVHELAQCREAPHHPQLQQKVWVGSAGTQELELCASHGVPSKKGVIDHIVDWKWRPYEVQFRSPHFRALREGWVIRMIAGLGLSWAQGELTEIWASQS